MKLKLYLIKNYKGLFCDCNNIIEIDLSKFNSLKKLLCY